MISPDCKCLRLSQCFYVVAFDQRDGLPSDLIDEYETFGMENLLADYEFLRRQFSFEEMPGLPPTNLCKNFLFPIFSALKN